MNGLRYYTIYKPFGVLSQFTPDHPGQPTLGDLFSFPKDVYPVGRLDRDSEGLLVLTNDNRLKTNVLSPSSGIRKTYWVQVEGLIPQEALIPLESGLSIRIKGKEVRLFPAWGRVLDHPPLLPDRVPPIRVRQTVPDSWVEIVLHEGKNRQVRRMMAAIGYPVLRLVRSQIASIQLEHMIPGEVQEWEQFDIYRRLGLA